MDKENKVKILLVAPYKESYLGLAKFPPLGLGYLATALRKEGYQDVTILDCLRDDIDRSGYKDYIKKNKPDIVGINSWSLAVNQINEILGITKEIDARIVTIIGGPHPSAVPLEAMGFFSSADFGFKGEAEIGLPMLVNKLSDKEKIDFKEIPGLIWKENQNWTINEQVFHKDLDDFDQLSWDLIKPQEYAQPGSITSGSVAPIITTRGCPYLCTFCSPHIIAGRKVRCRSSKNIIQEIKLLKEKYGMKKIAIMDENFTFFKNHALSLCGDLIKEKLNMKFFLPNGIRLDTLDDKLLQLMRKAGFTTSVAVGIESGSERILKMIRKHLKKESVREKIKLMRKNGFRPIGYFILGFPTETREEMYETLKFAKELKLSRAAFSPLLLLPETDIYKQLEKNGQLPLDYDFTSLSTDNLTCTPSGMTLDEFYKIRKDIILKFNLQPRVLLDYMYDFNSFVFAFLKFTEIFLKKQKTNADSKHNYN